MGHDAFLERHSRPNYKLHVFILMAIVGVSVFLSTQVEKSKQNTDIAALKKPVPIDSLAIESNPGTNSIPVIKPPVVTASQTESLGDEVVAEYAFDDGPKVAANQMTGAHLEEVENATPQNISTGDAGLIATAEAASTPDVAKNEESLQVAETEEGITTKRSASKMDTIYQQQQDRFLLTLAKTAELESKESFDIQRLKDAIRNDKPLSGDDKNANIGGSPENKSGGRDEKQSPTFVKVSENTDVQRTAKKNKQKINIARSRLVTTKVDNSRFNKNNDEVFLTKGELDKVLSQFTLYYNKGDINRLMTLFSVNASTNDQHSKLGIKADYNELFANTDTRNLQIKNMQWSLGKSKAEGKASFVVTVQQKNSNEQNLLQGNLKIIAVKEERGVYITHLLHELKPR